MCGFTGFLDLKRCGGEHTMRTLVTRMADTIRHRGPDDGQAWVDAEGGLAVGFRRLSIIDLSPAGRQPMVSACGRYMIVYNGEVYNAEELRPLLLGRGCSFRGHSDTEVILEACAAWGVEETVPKLLGMFAFALWDRRERTLTLARDRMGKKPLYYGQLGATCFFGSQPKSFRPHPDWRSEIDTDSLAGFMRFSYVPASRSIFRGLRQLRPGHIARINAAGNARERPYWDIAEVAAAGRANRITVSDREATDALERLLSDAVQRRMIADVPLGAFLSGGIDSSVVVALMQRQSTQPIKTFSIGFPEAGYDEAPHARRVAEHLGTDHREFYVDPSHAIDLIPQLPSWYDEPFADSSQIPTLLVSELAREHVTVVLSGDGGDELFAGYSRYAYVESLLGVVRHVPISMRPWLQRLLRRIPQQVWGAFGRLGIGAGSLGRRVAKLTDLLDAGVEEQLYRTMVGQWPDPTAVVCDSYEPVEAFWRGTLGGEIPDFIERMQFIDMVTYLPDDILTKVDRASMAVSLEARTPLLDHRVVEHCFRLPRHLKVRNGVSKWLLREVLYRHVPRPLIDRPKMGFGVPIDHWLRGPLRDWAEALLDERRLVAEGFFRPRLIRERWEQHLSGQINWQYQLWCVLMFQGWHEHWASAPAEAIA